MNQYFITTILKFHLMNTTKLIFITLFNHNILAKFCYFKFNYFPCLTLNFLAIFTHTKVVKKALFYVTIVTIVSKNYLKLKINLDDKY